MFSFLKKKKSYSGFELLNRLVATNWSTNKQLEAYEKSLYVFACVSKIAEKVASTDFNLFRILNSDGDVKEIPTHPIIDLLYRVNPYQTKAEFLKITVINLKLAGDAFWYKIRNSTGQVVELWNLRPDKVEIIKDPALYIKGYKFMKDDNTSIILAPEDIVHFKLPSPLDEYRGVSPIKSAQIRIDTESYAGAYQRDMFLNQGRPDAIIKYDGILTEDEKEEILKRFNSRHSGIGNNNKLAIFQGGLEYQQIAVTPRELDFIESMKFTRDDILVAFQVPKPIVAITDDVNLANAETAIKIFLGETIKPLVQYLCEKINEMLIIPDFGDTYFIWFDDISPESRSNRIAEYKAGLNDGWLTINEVRAKENLPPVEGGDEIYKPIGMVPIGRVTQNNNGAEKIKKLKVFKGKLIVQEKLRLFKEVKNTINNNSKNQKTLKRLIEGDEIRTKYANNVNHNIDEKAKPFVQKINNELIINEKKELIIKLKDQDFTKSIGRATKKIIQAFYKEQSKVWADFSIPFIEEWARTSGIYSSVLLNPNSNFEVTPRMREILINRAKKYSKQITSTTAERVIDAISNSLEAGAGVNEIAEVIGSVYDEFPAWRSALIARTEATFANNDGFIESYKQSGVVTHKEWVNAGDDVVRDSHSEAGGVGGEIVELDELFSNGCEYPGDPNGDPSEVINCRCVLAPVIEE